MKRNRVRRFLQQKQYTIASLVLFAAVAAMTGVYMSNKVTDSNHNTELAQKQKELIEEDTQGSGLDPDHLPDSGEEEVESVASVIRPKDSEEEPDAQDAGQDADERTGLQNNSDMDALTDTGMDDSTENGTENGTAETDLQGQSAQEENKDQEDPQTEEDTKTDTEKSGQDTEKKDTATQAKPAETVQMRFSPKSDLSWPLQGDVIMNYSMDQTVYFATLEQYKYNPALIIAGKVNEPVNAAATGRITDISTNEETGMTVTMDLGDGYTAVYGQLKEVLYKEDAVVEAGNAIGYIAEPTKYYSVEGSNLYFELQKDNKPVNPMQYMQ